MQMNIKVKTYAHADAYMHKHTHMNMRAHKHKHMHMHRLRIPASQQTSLLHMLAQDTQRRSSRLTSNRSTQKLRIKWPEKEHIIPPKAPIIVACHGSATRFATDPMATPPATDADRVE